jgi:hypothetical protein
MHPLLLMIGQLVFYGLTSTSTRIVIIEAPSIAPSDGDAATTSAATSTSS